MKQAGYISSETLSDIEDPNSVVVVSMWHSLENWDRWKNSGVRMQIEGEIEKLLDIPTAYEMYNLGVQF
jgi:heme-degrading monooxygenase HmoA